jgi:transcriptional regulator with XRE-family HTH domain
MDKLLKKKLALDRGKRVKLARTLTNLTRKELFEKYNINPNTIRSWEEGANLLTEPKAINLVKIFNQEGIAINLEWLLYGQDLGFCSKPSLDDKNQTLKDIVNIRGDLKIIDEINYFKHNNLNAISAMIPDESLFPVFCPGDFVGGIKVMGKNLNELVGTFCIIVTQDEQTIIKKIFAHKEQNFFLVGGVNPFTKTNDLHHFTCLITAAAKITRHWHVGVINHHN